MQGAQVQPWIWELSSHMPCGAAKKKKTKVVKKGKTEERKGENEQKTQENARQNENISYIVPRKSYIVHYCWCFK